VAALLLWAVALWAAPAVVLPPGMPPRAAAQSGAPDGAEPTGARDLVTERAVGPVALPDAPEGFVTERVGPVRWDFPERTRAEVQPLMARAPGSFVRIARELGGEIDPEIRIRVGRGPDEMRALAPPGAPPPDYAVGVAYPGLGLVLLTLTAPGSWQAPDLGRVLDHELSHIALFRKAGGRTRALPRWFVEGVAIHQAREQSLARIQALGGAAFGRGPIPWDRLSRSFPRRHHRVNLAYAQSADMVAYLRRGDDGERRFRKVIARVADGMTFPDAVARTYLAPLTVIEREWRDDLQRRFRLWPAGLTGGFLGFAALLLVLMGVWRRRRKARPVLERWAEEDALLDALEATHEEAMRRDRPGASGASPSPGDQAPGGNGSQAGAATGEGDDAGAGRSEPRRPGPTDARDAAGRSAARLDPEDGASEAAEERDTEPPGPPTPTPAFDAGGIPKVRIDGRTHTLH